MASSSEPIERQTTAGEDSSSNELHEKVSDGPTEPSTPKDDRKEDAKKDRFATAKKLWVKTQLDVPTMMIMAKGALAPTIGLAAYQATDFAETYTTLGYLVGIVSILSFAIMPRAKFLQTLFFNLVATCLAVSVALLAIYCAVQARLHTEASTTPGTGGAGSSGTPTPGAQTSAVYNSSASAVCGIWLFFQIYLVNTLRARYPQLVAPGIIWCIFANVSMVYAPQFSTMTQGIAFAKRLLETFMTGFAIGTGVSLFVFPITMRKVVFKEMTGYVMSLRGLIKANMAYLHSLEENDVFFARAPTGDLQTGVSPQLKALRGALAGLTALHGKFAIDLTFAKREIAWGKLGPDDLQQCFRHLRATMLPVLGLSQVANVFERIAEEKGWDHPAPKGDPEDPDEILRLQSVEDWHIIMKTLREPFSDFAATLDEGLAHVLYVLQLVKQPKQDQDDVEAKGDQPKPGQKDYTAYFERKITDFSNEKRNMLMKWCKLRDIELAPDFFEHPETAAYDAPEWYKKRTASESRSIYRRQLYVVLYMDYIFCSIGKAVLQMMQFADGRAESGKLSRSRLVVPGSKRMMKWFKSSFSTKEDAYNDDQHGMNEDGSRVSNVYLGEAFNKRKDPEHLPPANWVEKFGDRVRGFAHFLRSPESVFGFRVACATMCLAIVAFLHDTQRFYVTQRLFWSQIMITISMTTSSGQSVFSFFLRIVGTLAAMVTSFIVYYIVDGKTAGVLVFFWLVVMWGFYIVLKHPRIIPVGMIFSVTNTLIIGYELQVRKLGVTLSESNGQPYYPIYLLAPYRLATVCGGLFVAFIWTIFPYPISEHSELRKTLGSTLYLLANYYSVVHETVRVRIQGAEVNMDVKDSPARKLEKARQTVFSKSMLLLQGLRTHSAFLKYDVPIGGRFPKKTYDKIIGRIQDIFNFMSLISYASQTFSEMNAQQNGESESEWLLDFRSVEHELHMTSKEITTLLSLLSASVANAQPLPPYLRAPEPYALSSKLEALDKDIISVRHMAEPGFAAFAVLQISTKCIGDDLKALLR